MNTTKTTTTGDAVGRVVSVSFAMSIVNHAMKADRIATEPIDPTAI